MIGSELRSRPARSERGEDEGDAGRVRHLSVLRSAADFRNRIGSGKSSRWSTCDHLRPIVEAALGHAAGVWAQKHRDPPLADAAPGRVLIHAARVPDPQELAWKHVPEQLRDAARQVGGIVGAGDLTECIAYRAAEAFTADKELHLNDPSWFRPPVLYGFTFVNVTPLPFREYPGWMRFFTVGDEQPRRKSVELRVE